jgi:hypothetical protein
MLPFRVLPRPILDIRADLPPFGPSAAPRASTPTTGQTVCDLVTANTPTACCIPFIFNKLACRRSRRRATGRHISLVFSSPCRPFSSQQGGTPPSRNLQRTPRAQKERRNCAFFRNNFFACHTCAFYGGRGYLFHFVLESAALEHLQRVMIQGSQPRGDTGRTIDCICTGCGTIARTETIERKRRSKERGLSTHEQVPHFLSRYYRGWIPSGFGRGWNPGAEVCEWRRVRFLQRSREHLRRIPACFVQRGLLFRKHREALPLFACYLKMR